MLVLEIWELVDDGLLETTALLTALEEDEVPKELAALAAELEVPQAATTPNGEG